MTGPSRGNFDFNLLDLDLLGLDLPGQPDSITASDLFGELNHNVEPRSASMRQQLCMAAPPVTPPTGIETVRLNPHVVAQNLEVTASQGLDAAARMIAQLNQTQQTLASHEDLVASAKNGSPANKVRVKTLLRFLKNGLSSAAILGYRLDKDDELYDEAMTQILRLMDLEKTLE